MGNILGSLISNVVVVVVVFVCKRIFDGVYVVVVVVLASSRDRQRLFAVMIR